MNKLANIVLLIEQNSHLRRFLRTGFELEGYKVLESENAARALKIARFRTPDLIILDSVLSDLPGAEVLERIRSWSNVPIIMVCGVSSEEQKVLFVEAGADDYITKPFSMAELLARSEAALRRYIRTATEDPVVFSGSLSVDLVTKRVEVNGKPIRLTRQEYRLLHILAAHAGYVVTHDQLLKEVWPVGGGDIQYLRILIRKLRQKVEADRNNPRLIVTESGVGYRMEMLVEATAR
jgi:two-component system, OmpR family, KDP operon response regulator KdpE